MNPIYKTLFDTYGDSILREQNTYGEDAINRVLAPLSLDPKALLEVDNLFFNYYYRWSVDAFVLGLHLGLSLLDGQIRRPSPQESDQVPR